MIGFADLISRVFKLEQFGFADWIGNFVPRIAAAIRGLTKMKTEGQRQYQQIKVFKSEASSF